MVDLATLEAKDLRELSPSAMAELATRMLAELKVRDEQAQRDARAIRFKDAKIEKITFELGVDLFSVSKLTVRIPSNGAGSVC